MEGVADVDLPLLHALLSHKEKVPLEFLFAWIIGPGPPSSDQESCKCDKSLLEAEYWANKFNATTPHSFVVSFLNFVRAESQLALTTETESKVRLSASETERTRAGNVVQHEASGAPIPATRTAVDKESSSNAKYRSGAAMVNKRIVARHESTRLNYRSKEGNAHLIKDKMESVICSRTNEQSYDENFPVLSASANIKTQKSKGTYEKPRRRVNPTPMQNPVVDSAFVLAKVEHGNPSHGHDKSKTRTISSGPFKVDMDALMQRFERTKKQKQKDLHGKCGQESSHSPFTERNIQKNPSTEELLSTNPVYVSSMLKNSKEDGETHTKAAGTNTQEREMLPTQLTLSSFDLQVAPENNVQVLLSKPYFGKLKTVAMVHAKLLTAKLVPSLLGELDFLFQLLNMVDLCDMQVETLEIVTSTHLIETGHYGREREDEKMLFICKDDCSLYACAVMEQSECILNAVGEHLLSALIEHPAIIRHAPLLLSQIKGLLACHQAAALYSFKAYKYANRQSSQQPHVLSLEGTERQDLPGMPTCLPFDADRDSRNNYKTKESQKIYNNREICRDQFYAIIREAASVQNAFGLAVSAFEGDMHTRLEDSVRSLMKMLLAENYPWFTALFVEQVMQVAACGETDPVLADLARQDPAKLQRLHDRLTEGIRSRPVSFAPKHGGSGDRASEIHAILSPRSPWSKVKIMTNASKSKLNTLIAPKKNNDQQVGAQFDLLSLSPQFLRAYIWFLKAADSYRLNTQLIWSLTSKIIRISELSPHSRDAADIGSALTQRVLNLKALACLLGFLFFSPGTMALPLTPCLSDGHFSESEWDAERSDPPVDVLAALQKAQFQRSMLLTLPWVLDFLCWIKADYHALKLPYFRTIFSSLHDAYMYCLLDPQNAHFGVTSICILAELDSFFEYMDLPTWDIESCSDQRGSSKICQSTANRVIVSGNQASMGCELDTMIGVVDARYIQHCCPILMHLRSMLVGAQRRQKEPNKSFSPGPSQRKSIRKITPVQHPRPSQVSTLGEPLFMIEDAPMSDQDHMKVKLQQTFFKQRPQLQRLVDFIVDTAAVNAAHAASLKCIPPVLEEALKKLAVTFTERLKDDTSLGLDEIDRTAQIETDVEHIITISIKQALVPAMEYTRSHAADRISEALAAMAAPNETSTILGVAAGIAVEAASVAACKKTLASISSKLRKCITKEVECWRKNSQYSLLLNSLYQFNNMEKKKQWDLHAADNENTGKEVGGPLGGAKADTFVIGEMDWKDNIDNIFSEENNELNLNGGLEQSFVTKDETVEIYCKTSVVKRQLYFSDSKAEVVGDNSRLIMPVHAGKEEHKKVSLTCRIVQCCTVIQECCVSSVLNENKRYLLRLHVAAVCASLEGILMQVDKGLPARGFDALVFQKFPTLCTSALEFTDAQLKFAPCFDDAMMTYLSIERGLARRSIALALRFCLLHPYKAFGYGLDILERCFCVPVAISGLTSQKNSVDSWHSGNREMESGKYPREIHCSMRKFIGGPMEAIVSMWIALLRCGLCETNFILAEFLAPWRWMQSLVCEPWKSSSFWLQAVVHGVVNLLLKLVNEALASQEAEKIIYKSLKEMGNIEVIESGLNLMVEHLADVYAWREEVKNLSTWISMKLVEEQLLLEKKFGCSSDTEKAYM